jgi:DNA-binding NarL/FixJ family response regulator
MRILIADSQPKVRFAMRVLLERQPGLKVTGEATDAYDLLNQAETSCVDVVLLAWSLAGVAAGDFLCALRKVCPDLFVIVLSGRPEVRRAALDAGADAFVSKTDPPEYLLMAIKDCGKRGVCHEEERGVSGAESSHRTMSINGDARSGFV